MGDIKEAWRAFRRTPPPYAADRLELAEIRVTPTRLEGLTSVALPAFVGLVVIAIANLWETLHPVAHDVVPTTIGALLRSQDFLLHGVVEIGVAFLVAAIVSFFIERRARVDQTRLFAEAIKVLGDDVIQGVYGIRHDKEYVRAVVASCLAVRHIRRGYQVSCHVSDFTAAECAKLGIVPGTLVKFEVDVKYESVNIGDRRATFHGRYSIPKRGKKVGEFTRMTLLEVGGVSHTTAAQIEALEIKPDHPEFNASDRSYAFDIETVPHVPTRIHLKAIMAKERSDNEIFTFLLPTIGAEIRFHFDVRDLAIGAKARTATTLLESEEIIPSRDTVWRLRGPLLPNNHVTVWWREPAEDGAPTEAQLDDTLGNRQEKLVQPKQQNGPVGAPVVEAPVDAAEGGHDAVQLGTDR